MTSKFDVVVFQRMADYDELTGGRVHGSAGVFIADLRVLAAYTQGRTTEQVLRTLYHEGFHQFMYSVVSPEAPTWANEGIAEYFSNATWNGQDFTLGEVPVAPLYVIQKAVRDGTYIPFRRLLYMSHEQWLQTSVADRSQADLLYSESWSIVHFLIHADGGSHAPMLNRLLKEIAQGQLTRSAMEDVFGTEFRQIESAWARYVMGLTPSPKFRCRDNMEILLLLAEFIYKDPRKLTGVEQLRHDVLYQNRSGWQIVLPHGAPLTWDQTDRVAALFRCPLDRSGADRSYLVVRNVQTGLPTLVCMHHPGVVELAYYEPDGRGGYKITVEEQVWDTLPPDLQQAIRTAGR